MEQARYFYIKESTAHIKHADERFKNAINEIENLLKVDHISEEELGAYLCDFIEIINNHVNWNSLRKYVGELSPELESFQVYFYFKILLMYIIYLIQYSQGVKYNKNGIDEFLGLKPNPDLLWINAFKIRIEEINRAVCSGEHFYSKEILMELLWSLKNLREIINKHID